MIYLSKWFPLKMLVFTLVTLYVLLTISSSMAYMGTRYGKREYDMNRLQSRSIGQRSIANRGARFYPGSRYGGKRSYWQAGAPTDSDAESPLAVASSSFNTDCIRLPFARVRCPIRPDEPTYNDEESSSGNALLAGGNLPSSGGSSSMAEQP